VSLGIGPIVTASIILQLLAGSGILKLDLTTAEGKKRFQGIQKFLALFFIVFEALIYVFMGGLSPSPSLTGGAYLGMQWMLILQLIIGGVLILFMDEVVQKWGFGSGVSLFIAAGVSAQIFIRAFSPLTSAGTLALGTGQAPTGVIFVLINSLTSGNTIGASLALAAIASTIIVFLIAVYAQAMKVEIPLSFGRIRGHGIEWKQCMLNAGVVPKRLYDIDRTGLVRQYKKYSAACACVSVWVSGVRAAKIKKGELACGKCKATLVLTGYVYPDDDATIAKSA